MTLSDISKYTLKIGHDSNMSNPLSNLLHHIDDTIGTTLFGVVTR